MARSYSRVALAGAFLALFALPAVAQDGGYRPAPPAIAQILDAPPTPTAELSPTREWLLLVEPAGAPPVAELASPYLGLAGYRVNPRTNGEQRAWAPARGLRLVRVGAGEPRERRLETPESRRIGDVRWAPDGAHVAYTVTTDDGIALWVADVATGRSRRLTEPRLNGLLGGCRWAGSARLACTLIPDRRGPAPAANRAPTAPAVQETGGGASTAIWTLQDLLTSPADEALLEHYFSGQVAFVALDGTVTPVGRPGIHTSVQPSPDGRYLAVQTVHRPYSYQVDLSSFPTRTEVWSADGRVVREIADRPLQELFPAFDRVTVGPRALRWRADAPATLVWVEALDGGDPARPAERRDRVLMLAAPFAGEPTPLIELGFRFQGAEWTRDGRAVVHEDWQTTRRTRSWLVDTRTPNAPPRLLVERSSEDRYADPGSFVTAPGPAGTSLVVTTADGRWAYRTGRGASPEGDRPFLDRVNLATGTVEPIWRSAAPHYEEVVALVDPAARQLVTRRESVTEPPDYHLRDLARGTLVALTRFPHPAPPLAGATRQQIRYTRADGVALTATLYLPAGYDRERDGPLPFLLWAYPTEYKDAAAAAQVRGSPYRFAWSELEYDDHLMLLTQGYGVLNDPSMPIIGEGDTEPNDTYVEQLVASAQAAIDTIVAMGVADRDRIAVGGHSYGAFMTANLLAHSRLFRAGIARSGAYNRSLTPFGFQRESRTYWQARDVYLRMSPFTYADQVKDAILFIHGEVDSNPGTYTMQSERMYAAVKGNGGTARLVLLPGEDHGYLARESKAHALWEMTDWLDRQVKPKRKPASN